jgi:hypothetical protein
MAGSGRLARGSATAVWTTQRDILPEAGASIGAELRVVKWPSDWGVVRNEQRHLCYLRVEEGRDQRLVVLCEAGVAAIRNMRESQELPEATPVRARCLECEYANYCADVW